MPLLFVKKWLGPKAPSRYLPGRTEEKHQNNRHPNTSLEQWYSSFHVRVPPDVISLQL
jgi:hypothetical protein